MRLSSSNHLPFTTWLCILLCAIFCSLCPSIQAQSANTNPSTDNGPDQPEDKPDSEDDGTGSPSDEPVSPEDTSAEGDKSCEDEDEDDPDDPSSVDVTFSLAACPLEYSISTGRMRLYIDEPVENMGDPVHLKYHSIANAKIVERITEGLPANVTERIVIRQVSGKTMQFDHKDGDPVIRPSGNAAFSSARLQLYDAAGQITSMIAEATTFRQYRSAGGYMEFSAETGDITKWAGPTGRGLSFPENPSEGVVSMGLEVVRVGEIIRQVKSPAGMLDVIVDGDGRGYKVITYLPSQVGDKSGDLYQLIADAKPQRTVHVQHLVDAMSLLITQTDHAPADGGQDRVRVSTFKYVDTFDGGHAWELEKQAGDMKLSSVRHVVPDKDIPGMRKIIREIKDAAGAVTFRKEVIQQYQETWKGWTTLQTADYPGGDEALKKINRYRFGIDPSKNDFRKRNWMMTHTGKTYEFFYDDQGRLTERRSPWLSGAGGLLLIEKYDYTPHVSGETVLPGDGRPRTTTKEVGSVGGQNAVISKSYFAAYNDTANNNRHTVINEDAATPQSAFGAAENRYAPSSRWKKY